MLKHNGATAADDFIEVHVYDKLDLTAIEQFRAPKPKADDDLVLARRLKRKLGKAGVQIETLGCTR